MGQLAFFHRKFFPKGPGLYYPSRQWSPASWPSPRPSSARGAGTLRNTHLLQTPPPQPRCPSRKGRQGTIDQGNLTVYSMNICKCSSCGAMCTEVWSKGEQNHIFFVFFSILCLFLCFVLLFFCFLPGWFFFLEIFIFFLWRFFNLEKFDVLSPIYPRDQTFISFFLAFYLDNKLSSKRHVPKNKTKKTMVKSLLTSRICTQGAPEAIYMHAAGIAFFVYLYFCLFCLFWNPPQNCHPPLHIRAVSDFARFSFLFACLGRFCSCFGQLLGEPKPHKSSFDCLILDPVRVSIRTWSALGDH